MEELSPLRGFQSLTSGAPVGSTRSRLTPLSLLKPFRFFFGGAAPLGDTDLASPVLVGGAAVAFGGRKE